MRGHLFGGVLDFSQMVLGGEDDLAGGAVSSSLFQLVIGNAERGQAATIFKFIEAICAELRLRNSPSGWGVDEEGEGEE